MGKGALGGLPGPQAQQHNLTWGDRIEGPAQGGLEGFARSRPLLPHQAALAFDAKFQQRINHHQLGPGRGHQAKGIALVHRFHPGRHPADRHRRCRPLPGQGRQRRQHPQPSQEHRDDRGSAQANLPEAVAGISQNVLRD